jgi:hypothetical protein
MDREKDDEQLNRNWFAGTFAVAASSAWWASAGTSAELTDFTFLRGRSLRQDEMIRCAAGKQ